ncbi:MAG: hypothetical protein R6W82_06885 [bacterium]
MERTSRTRSGPRSVVLLLGALLMGMPAHAAAQSSAPDAGTTSLPLLNLGFGGRGAALGEALTAWPGGADAVYWNPAASVPSPGSGSRVDLAGARLFGDVQQSGASWAAGWGRTAWTIQVLYSGVGDIPVRGPLPTPEPLGVTSAHDLVGAVAVALPLPAGGSVGAAVKGVYEKLDVYDAAGAAVDGGLQVPLPVWGDRLQFGLAIRNVGRVGRLGSERLRLPWSRAVGVALARPLSAGRWELLGGADIWKPSGDWTQFRAGIEARREVLSLRAGLRLGEGWRTVSAGIGLDLGGYELDYAYVYDGDPDRRFLGNLQRIGLRVRLGGGRGR